MIYSYYFCKKHWNINYYYVTPPERKRESWDSESPSRPVSSPGLRNNHPPPPPPPLLPLLPCKPGMWWHASHAFNQRLPEMTVLAVDRQGLLEEVQCRPALSPNRGTNSHKHQLTLTTPTSSTYVWWSSSSSSFPSSVRNLCLRMSNISTWCEEARVLNL